MWGGDACVALVGPRNPTSSNERQPLACVWGHVGTFALLSWEMLDPALPIQHPGDYPPVPIRREVGLLEEGARMGNHLTKPYCHHQTLMR
jgi:hypothetical protein